MRQVNRRQLVLVLIFLIALGGCDTNRQSSRSLLFDNGRFMDLWGTYMHCIRSEDLDAMHEDAHRLLRVVHTTGFTEDPIPLKSSEPIPGQTIRLSVDPAAMAAACALRAGQAAREKGRLYVSREMFHTIIIHFQQPRYQYYAAQARLGLERLDALSRAALHSFAL
jgi:hypothetical protein